MSEAAVILVAKALDAVLLGMEMRTESKQALGEISGQLKKMAAERRSPTDREWEDLNRKIDDELRKLNQ